MESGLIMQPAGVSTPPLVNPVGLPRRTALIFHAHLTVRSDEHCGTRCEECAEQQARERTCERKGCVILPTGSIGKTRESLRGGAERSAAETNSLDRSSYQQYTFRRGSPRGEGREPWWA